MQPNAGLPRWRERLACEQSIQGQKRSTILFFLFFSADGSFGGLKTDAAVRAVAEWLVHRAAAAAKREVCFSGEIVFLSIGVNELD
jgi:hypothetical protein